MKVSYRSLTPERASSVNGNGSMPTRLPVSRALPSDARPPPTKASLEADRAARLAAMSSSANQLTSERRQRLEAMLEQEKQEKEREEKERMRHSKSGGVGGFLDGERRRVYAGGMEGGLGERIRRGRGAMVGVE